MKRLMETLFDLWPVRFAVALGFLARATLFSLLGRHYRALDDLCWIARVSRTGWPESYARRRVMRVRDQCVRTAPNKVVEWFRADPAGAAAAGRYQQSGRGPRDIFRDVMVLKAWRPQEKGVILLKYARTFIALAALYDLEKLMERYTFVLEPCWAGYCDPCLLMFLTPAQPVIVQCFTEEDHAFISELGAPFVPIRQGPADWVNADMFRPEPGGVKNYDLVMVANWAPHKRHATLFNALRDVRDRDLRVLLVGFAWHSRTAEDIRRESEVMANPRVTLDIRESLPQSELAVLVAQAKVFVFLSRKEGDNKALVEGLFADVPAIVYAESVGGARSRINSATGVLAHDHELAAKIRHMLDHRAEFSPRAWALEHTGSTSATRILNELLARTATAAGGQYTQGIVEKTNAPNLAYKRPEERNQFEADYAYVRSCQLQ
jgi:glycosyltransferase involved in cell wall biosynthesis